MVRPSIRSLLGFAVSIVALFGSLMSPQRVRAADQTVLGSQLLVKNPSTPDERKISAKAKEVGSDDTIVGDPVMSGATLTITANGGTTSSETYDLPPGVSTLSTKPFWSGDAVKGFKYKDAKGENGPVKTAQIKNKGGVFQIKAVIDGKLAPVAVVPPDPGTHGCALFAIADGDSYSMQFATGLVTNKGPLLFKVKEPTADGSCVTITTSDPSSSTSTTTSSTSTMTMTSTTATTTPPTTSTTLGTGGDQLCPAAQFATAIDANGTLVCATIDPLVQAAVNTECFVYMGQRDNCDGCALPPTKWGRAGATTCTNGVGGNNTCTTTALRTQTVELFGLNMDGDVDEDDKLYISLHCGLGSSASTPGPCGPDRLMVDSDGTNVTCMPVSGAVLEYVRNNCILYLGSRDGCDGCTTPPAKWGNANDGSCTNGLGADNTCTTETLGSETVRLFGLNSDGDGDVDDNDKIYVGLRCNTPPPDGGPSDGPCPPGQFVVGTHLDGTLQCSSPSNVAVTYFRNQCAVFFGWRDSCDGCGSPPAKWGSMRDGFCANGTGANDTCTTPTLGTEMVSMFGLNTDGNVDDNDTFYVGFRCF